MSIAAIKAGKAFYEIYANDKTAKGLSDAEASLRKFGVRVGMIGASMAAMGAAALTTLGGLAMQFARSGDEIGDAMAKTGASAEWLQVLSLAADKADVSFEGIVKAIGRMQRGIVDGKLTDELLLVGLSAQQLAAMKPEEAFLAIGDALGEIEDPALRSKRAVQLFGNAGAGLLPMFEKGAGGIRDLFDKLKGQGLLLGPEQIASAGKLDDAIVLLKFTISQTAQMIGAALAPALTELIGIVQPIIASVARFATNNRALIVSLATGAAVLTGVGLALMAVGGAAIMLTIITAGLTAAWAAIGAAFAFLLSPVGLVIAALAACAVAAYQLDQIFNNGTGFNALTESLMSAVRGVGLLWSAISNGRWDLAGQLIMDGIILGVEVGIGALQSVWLDFRDWFINLMVDMSAGMVSIMLNGMKTVIDSIQGFAGRVGIEVPGINAASRGLGRASDATDSFGNRVKDSFARDSIDQNEKQAALIAAAAIKLDETIAAIKAVEEARKAAVAEKVKRTGPIAAQGILLGESVGATSSAAAALLGRAAPVNSVEDKQLDAQLEGNDLLDKLLGAVEGLEGLTAD